MTHRKTVTWLWLVLIILTLSGSLLGERAEPGYFLIFFVTLSMAFKGRMVVDHFMELKNSHPLLRNLMQAYFYVLPLITIISYILSTARL
ncbi:MAG: cytochrome C oxidase subunit IV family protein [Thiohalomonadaceae bacterium]